MVNTRRARPATTEKRQRILDSTEEIILERGYAAVTSRSVAERVGIQPPHLHYYFKTIDDLFVAVLHRRSHGAVERMSAALESSEPLRAWWALASDRRGTALLVELLAAANHRAALRAEMAEMAKDIRRLQMEHLEVLLEEYGIDPKRFTPALVAATMQGLAFAVVADEAAGYDTCPEQAASDMDRLVSVLELRRGGGAGDRRETS